MDRRRRAWAKGRRRHVQLGCYIPSFNGPRSLNRKKQANSVVSSVFEQGGLLLLWMLLLARRWPLVVVVVVVDVVDVVKFGCVEAPNSEFRRLRPIRQVVIVRLTKRTCSPTSRLQLHRRRQHILPSCYGCGGRASSGFYIYMLLVVGACV